MKKLFFILLSLAFLAFIALRIHQFNFERNTGHKFDVMDFELPGSVENLNSLILQWDATDQKEFVLDQLKIDYFFMFFLFPAIAVLNLWARKRIISTSKEGKEKSIQFLIPWLLIVVAVLQFVALGFDLSENIRLTQWINQGYALEIGCFEALVRLKFLFAFLGIGTGISAHVFVASIATPAVEK